MTHESNQKMFAKVFAWFTGVVIVASAGIYIAAKSAAVEPVAVLSARTTILEHEVSGVKTEVKELKVEVAGVKKDMGEGFNNTHKAILGSEERQAGRVEGLTSMLLTGRVAPRIPVPTSPQ